MLMLNTPLTRHTNAELQWTVMQGIAIYTMALPIVQPMVKFAFKFMVFKGLLQMVILIRNQPTRITVNVGNFTAPT